MHPLVWPQTMKDKDWAEEEESEGNNGDEDDRYLLEEI